MTSMKTIYLFMAEVQVRRLRPNLAFPSPAIGDETAHEVDLLLSYAHPGAHDFHI